MKEERSNQRVCCIPSAESENAESISVGDTPCRYLKAHHHHHHHHNNIHNAKNSSMVIQSGPHGLHAIASKDINAGSLIVQCLPLAHSILLPPGMPMEEDEGDDDDDCGKRRRCSRCFFREGDEDPSGMRRKKFGRCSKCRVAYYCSRSCQADDWNEQHKLECQYYVKRRKQSPTPTPFYAQSPEEDALPLLLRTFNSLKLLRENSDKDANTRKDDSAQKDEEDAQGGDTIVSCGPRHFSSLAVSPEHIHPSTSTAAFGSSSMALAKDLMSSYAARGSSSKDAKKEKTEKRSDAMLRIWGYESTVGDNNNNTPSYTPDQAIQRALNAFQKNNFGIVNSLHSPVGEGVYPCAALLNHSCSPNCILRYKLGAINNMGKRQYHPPILQIVACRDIAFGEELSHSYVDLALCTEERQARLMETHGFVCECKRCKQGGCSMELPKRREEWELWPLRKEFQAQEKNSSMQTKSNCMKVYLDDAMTRCLGLSGTEQAHIIQQSHVLQEKANQSMVNGDALGELHNLHKATELYTTRGRGGTEWLSPFHGQLYSVRCSYLSALLANGQIHQAVEECEHVVSFLAVAFSHVQNHPLLGLQLYTLGDLYAAASTMGDGRSLSEGKKYATKSTYAYTWAKKVMMVTHGANDPMVQTLDDNIANGVKP